MCTDVTINGQQSKLTILSSARNGCRFKLVHPILRILISKCVVTLCKSLHTQAGHNMPRPTTGPPLLAYSPWFSPAVLLILDKVLNVCDICFVHIVYLHFLQPQDQVRVLFGRGVVYPRPHGFDLWHVKQNRRMNRQERNSFSCAWSKTFRTFDMYIKTMKKKVINSYTCRFSTSRAIGL